jgi:hypothetical protein
MQGDQTLRTAGPKDERPHLRGSDMKHIPTWLGSQDSRLWAVLTRTATLLGIIFPIATIASLLATGSGAVPATILSIYVCTLATALIFLLIRQENRYYNELISREDRYESEIKRFQSERAEFQRLMQYAPATMPMRSAYTCIAEASWNLFQGDRSQTTFRLHLQEALRYFAEAYLMTTGNRCRASIKLIRDPSNNANPNDLEVATLCRDANTPEKMRVEPDRIVDNTDFKQIFREPRGFFMSNDLPADRINKGYKNSHWTEEVIENDAFEYRATIVWPIDRAAPDSMDGKDAREIIGFLCVDTLQTGAFHDTYDVAIGAAFSQALHLALHRYRAIVSRSQKTTTTTH